MIYEYILLRTTSKKRSHAFLRAIKGNSQLSTAAQKVYYRINTFDFTVVQGGPLCHTKPSILEMMERITFNIPS
jgi:hypothetical protein